MFVKSFVRRNGPLEREEICFQQNMSLEKKKFSPKHFIARATQSFFPKRFEINGRVISCLIVAAVAACECQTFIVVVVGWGNTNNHVNMSQGF